MPGTKVTEQGGGRIDVAAAMGPVTATGSVTLAPLQSGGTGGQTATVRYTNTGDHPITLSLAVNLATETGRAIPDGVVSPDSGTVQLAPGATADVPLRTDAAHAVRGNFYGYITAKSADGAVLAHTTVSLVVHAPQHRLTLVSRDRNGQIVPGALPNIWGPDGFVQYTDRDAGVAVVEEGTYYLSSGFFDRTDDGEEVGEIVDPEVKVTKDMTVTLNAADVTEVKVPGQVGVGRRFGSTRVCAGDPWSAAAGGQDDEELAAARLDVGGHRQPRYQSGEPVHQPIRRLLGVPLGRTTAHHLAAPLALQPPGNGDQRRGFDHVQAVRPGDDHLDRALAGVASAVREPLGDLGLPVGSPAVDAGSPRVVHRLVGVDRFVTHPAPPAVALGHIIKETHPSKLACPAATPRTRAPAKS